MRYKKFDKANMDLSVITVGTWVIGADGWGDVDKKDSIKAIHTMVDKGVNFIDTAPAYGNGHSEVVVGEAISSLDRSKLFIATKFGSTRPDGPNSTRIVRDNSRANIMKEVEESLDRMNIDYIDLYICHWPDAEQKSATFEETISAMEELRKSGKIRFLGLSNYNIEQMKECQKYGQIDWLQSHYSMVNLTAEADIKWASENGIATMTYGSLGAGILTGAIREKPDFAERDRRGTFYGELYREPKFSQIMKLMETLDAIAADHKVPVAQVALNWCTQSPIVTSALVGVRNPAEAMENCAGTLWELSKAEMDKINKAIEDSGNN